MREILSALLYMHIDKNICHRDIKPDNIIIQEIDPVKIKILDFNVAKKMTKGMKMITKTGLEEWSAPEMLNGVPYTEKIDSWSTGCIFYYMLFGEKPFKSKESEELHRSISIGEFDIPTN